MIGRVCPTCGCDDIEEDDGQFFCSSCQTQCAFDMLLQDDNEYQESNEHNPFAAINETLVPTKRRRKVSAQVDFDTEGTSWAVYSRVILQQCDILASLGFPSPAIYVVVLRLYLQFLKGSGALNIKIRSDRDFTRVSRHVDAFILKHVPLRHGMTRKELNEFNSCFPIEPVQLEVDEGTCNVGVQERQRRRYSILTRIGEIERVRFSTGIVLGSVGLGKTKWKSISLNLLVQSYQEDCSGW
ncbi:hypothetical protein ACOME3_004576 [Neoechinorhynchus agilis]